MDTSKGARALASGLAGACVLTLIHQAAKNVLPHPPRMDVIGMRAITRLARKADWVPPSGERLYRAALAGDLVSNTLYFSHVGLAGGRYPWLLGSLLGLGAGVGAAALPPRIGLGRQPGERRSTLALTVAWYLAAGLTAACTLQWLQDKAD